MTTSAAPRLTRLVQVTGTSTITDLRHAPAAYQRASMMPEPGTAGVYYLGAVAAARASELAAKDISVLFSEMTYGRQGYQATDTWPISRLFGAGADHLYLLHPETGADVVRWPIRSVTGYTDRLFDQWGPLIAREGYGPVLICGPGQMVGDDFDLAAIDHTRYGTRPEIWGLETVEVQIPTTRTVNRRVWARITERGADAGMIATVGRARAQQQQGETATVTVRYDPALSIGQELTDDLARVWDVAGTRAILDRRYLVYECERRVAATPPDVPAQPVTLRRR